MPASQAGRRRFDPGLPLQSFVEFSEHSASSNSKKAGAIFHPGQTFSQLSRYPLQEHSLWPAATYSNAPEREKLLARNAGLPVAVCSGSPCWSYLTVIVTVALLGRVSVPPGPNVMVPVEVNTEPCGVAAGGVRLVVTIMVCGGLAPPLVDPPRLGVVISISPPSVVLNAPGQGTLS